MSMSVAPPPSPIRVAIIEDERDVREGLALLIHNTDGFACTARFPTMELAIEGLGPDSADVALVDIGLPGMSGIAGISFLKARCPKLLILILTVYKDDDRVFEALCQGANGYLLKKTPPVRLLESLKEVMEGGAPMSPEIARRVVELFGRYRPPTDATCQLSPQESHLLKLLCEGHHYKTAAVEMGLSVHTVGFHMRNIYDKLQVHSKSEAVAKALRAGFVR